MNDIRNYGLNLWGDLDHHADSQFTTPDNMGVMSCLGRNLHSLNALVGECYQAMSYVRDGI